MSQLSEMKFQAGLGVLKIINKGQLLSHSQQKSSREVSTRLKKSLYVRRRSRATTNL